MKRFVLTSFALALPWLLLFVLYAQWNFPNRDCLRIGHIPNTHGTVSNYDLHWEKWIPFHHLSESMPASESDDPPVRLLGLGDSFSENIIRLAQKHLPNDALPWRIESRFNWGIISTARASMCLIAEVDSGAYTDFLLVNVERGFRQIGRQYRPDCMPELNIRPHGPPQTKMASDTWPAGPGISPIKPPVNLKSLRSAWTSAEELSMRDVWDFYTTNARRALAPSMPENLGAGKLRTRRDLPMTCPHSPDDRGIDHIFFVRDELQNTGTDTTGLAATMFALRTVKAACQAKGMRFHMMLVPDKTTTYADWVLLNPNILQGKTIDRVYYQTIIEHMASSDLFTGEDAGTLVNVLDLFEERHAAGDYDLFNHGDTHWSLTGAGIAFRWWLRNAILEME